MISYKVDKEKSEENTGEGAVGVRDNRVTQRRWPLRCSVFIARILEIFL